MLPTHVLSRQWPRSRIGSDTDRRKRLEPFKHDQHVMVQFAHNDMWLPVLWVFWECVFLNNEDRELQTTNAFDHSPTVYLLLPSASEIGWLHRMQQ